MKLQWGKIEDKVVEYGVSKGVVYDGTKSIPWPGLISVKYAPQESRVNSMHVDSIAYGNHSGESTVQFDITTIALPRELKHLIGDVQAIPGMFLSQQNRQPFHLCFRTETNRGYALNLVYNCTLRSSNNKHSTGAPSSPKFKLSCVPEKNVPATVSPSAYVTIISSVDVSNTKMTSLENILYGTVSTNPRMPTIMETWNLLKVV